MFLLGSIDFARPFVGLFQAESKDQLGGTYLKSGLITFAMLIFLLIFIMLMFIPLFLLIPLSQNESAGIIIISFFVIFGFLIMTVPFLFYALPMGYVTESIRLELIGNQIYLPSWENNYRKYFISGLKLMFLMVVFFLLEVFIIGFILGSIYLILSALAGLSPDSPLFILFIFVFFIMHLLSMALLPALWVIFSKNGSILEALNPFNLLEFIFADFVSYIILSVGSLILLIAYSVALQILVYTCIGIIVVPLIQFILMPMNIMNVFAQLYRKAVLESQGSHRIFS